jgi:hypothetical protein
MKRTETVQVRLSLQEREALEAGAKARNMSLSAYVRAAACDEVGLSYDQSGTPMKPPKGSPLADLPTWADLRAERT